MKASIDRSGCISCGICNTASPEVFAIADDGLAEVIKDPIPPEQEESAKEAAESCPVSVISIE